MSIEILRRLMEPLWLAIRSTVVSGEVRLSYNGGNGRKVQATLLSGETRDNLDAPEPYGFTSAPKAGAELVATRVHGSIENTVILLVADRRYRLKILEEGDVAIYNDEGSYVWLKRGNKIEIGASGGVKILGSLEVTGDVSDQVGSLAALRAGYNAHTHVENGTGGGVTDPPIPTDPPA